MSDNWGITKTFERDYVTWLDQPFVDEKAVQWPLVGATSIISADIHSIVSPSWIPDFPDVRISLNNLSAVEELVYVRFAGFMKQAMDEVNRNREYRGTVPGMHAMFSIFFSSIDVQPNIKWREFLKIIRSNYEFSHVFNSWMDTANGYELFCRKFPNNSKR